MNFTNLLAQYSGSEQRSLENSNPNRVRYNVYSPEGEKALILFEKAVALMKDRSVKNPGDPLGWSYQAGIHGIWNLDYSNPSTAVSESREKLAEFAEQNKFDTKQNVLDGNTVLNNCTHFADLWNTGLQGGSAKTQTQNPAPANFIAWHRLYLQYFEEIVRENLRLSGEEEAESWALPYWAYLNEGEFVMPELLRKSDSSLYTPYRNAQLNEGIPLTDLTNINDLINYDPIFDPKKWPGETLPGLYKHTYLAMGTAVENTPHNLFHVVSGTDGGLFANRDGLIVNGLMLPPQSAAFDPVFWIHHSFIDKLWSAYNASNNAFYGFEYFFDQNPWNYMFLVPPIDGKLQKETISYWGDNSANVVSKIYNPDYSYDYFGTSTNPESLSGPNKALSIIQSPAFRPTISSISWNQKSEKKADDLYISVIPLTVGAVQATWGDYRNLTNPNNQKGNPFDFVSEVDLLVPENKYVRIALSTQSALVELEELSVNNPREFWEKLRSKGLFVQPWPMGMQGMAMPMTATIDFEYSEYIMPPNSIDDSDPLVLIAWSDSEEASVTSVETSLNQNLNFNSSSDSTFDAAAYFAQFPELLSNSDATADPQAYYEKHDKNRGIVAPEINFRAAATGMAYLMKNPDLVSSGVSSSPYSAISHYLDHGQKQGLSLGDTSLMEAQSYLLNSNSGGTILDFSNLDSGREISADIIIGRDAAFKPVVGFYHVVDTLGSIVIDGVSYKPGDSDYGRLATSNANIYDPLTGLNANEGTAELKTRVRFTSDIGLLAPFAVVNDRTFFSFSDANIDKIGHFRIHGTNILGLEDLLHGGDTDYDDTLIGFVFDSQTTALSDRGGSSMPLMSQMVHMLG